MAEVVYETAQQRGMTAPRPGLARVLFYPFGLMFGLLIAVYLMLRVLNIVALIGTVGKASCHYRE